MGEVPHQSLYLDPPCFWGKTNFHGYGESPIKFWGGTIFMNAHNHLLIYERFSNFERKLKDAKVGSKITTLGNPPACMV